MNFEQFENELLKSSNYKKNKESLKDDLAFILGKMILEGRIFKGITQKELARLVKTKQPSIARIENGSQLPSLSFVKKIAEALGTHLIPPKLGFFEDMEKAKIYQRTPLTKFKAVTWPTANTPRAQTNTYNLTTQPDSTYKIILNK